MKVFFAALAAVIVLGLLVVGGYQLDWWLREDATNRTAQIDQNSYANQRGAQVAVAQAAEDASDIDVKIAATDDPNVRAALAAQKEAVTSRGCQSARNINQPVSQDVVDFAYTYCNLSLEAN